MLLSKGYGFLFLLVIALIMSCVALMHPAVAQATQADCASPSATAEATSEATLEATVEVTSEATAEISDVPLQLDSFMPTDIHFNPDADQPFALITVYSLIFQNQLNQALHIEKPHFQLTINDVDWGELVSTDFQTGVLQPYAIQGIVLQNLTIIAKTTPAQQAILTCLKTYQPVDLTLTGTLDVFPNGIKQTLPLTLTTRQVVLREH